MARAWKVFSGFVYCALYVVVWVEHTVNGKWFLQSYPYKNGQLRVCPSVRFIHFTHPTACPLDRHATILIAFVLYTLYTSFKWNARSVKHTPLVNIYIEYYARACCQTENETLVRLLVFFFLWGCTKFFDAFFTPFYSRLQFFLLLLLWYPLLLPTSFQTIHEQCHSDRSDRSQNSYIYELYFSLSVHTQYAQK